MVLELRELPVQTYPMENFNKTPNQSSILETSAKIALAIALGALIVFIAYRAAKRNSLKEKCSNNLHSNICKQAIGKTFTETVSRSTPVVLNCIPPNQVKCVQSMGLAFLKEIGGSFPASNN